MLNVKSNIVLPLLIFTFMYPEGDAQNVARRQLETRQVIEKGFNAFPKSFTGNAPQASNVTISDCKLVSDLAAMSALKQYGKDPVMTDLLMLTLSGWQRAWPTLLYIPRVKPG